MGLAIRRWCAPVLELSPLPSPDEYLTRRAELGAEEVHRRFLQSAGLEALLVETGHIMGADLLGPAAMELLAAAPAHQVVRLETVAEAVGREGVDAAAYPDAFARALEEVAAGAVGLKTVVAYRGGFKLDPTRPSTSEVMDAAGRWLSTHGAPRLEDPVLLRHGIWTGAELAGDRGLPLQIHAGYGDPDLTLHLVNPSLLTDLVRALGQLQVDVVFLHCYPYHREAAYLAAVYPMCTSMWGWPFTTRGQAPSGSWRRPWSWRHSPNSSTPPMASRWPSSTTLVRCCSAAAWRRSSRTGCAARSARRPTRTASPDSSAATTPTGSTP